MIKKILVVLIAALCCLLIGLLVLFFYINISVNKKSSILSFIPSQTQFVLRIKKTSETTNNVFSNHILSDFLAMDELRSTWNIIDSITSRNYKTTEVLLKNTSYICVDSANQYLILVDLNKKTNEHFIDQFLVNSTQLRKIEKYKEGYKAFFPQENKPFYYFVKQNVFALSSNQDFILSSLQQAQTETPKNVYADWDLNSQADLSFWSTKGTEQKIFTHFESNLFDVDWDPKRMISNSTEIDFNKSVLTINSKIVIDTSSSQFSVFYSQPKESLNYFYQADTGVWENKFYSLQILDSLQNYRPASFTYSSFVDSSGGMACLLVTQSPILLSKFQSLTKDPSVQIIPMADENILQIAVFDVDLCKKMIPIVPFINDTIKLFATIYKGKLFIGNSTETILSQASIYPGTNFIKKKLVGTVIIYCSSSRRMGPKPYSTEYTYQLTGSNTISFTSEIKPGKSN